MHKLLTLTLAAAALAAPAFADTKSYNFTGFTKIDVDSAFEIEFTQSPNYSVVVDSNPNHLDKIIVEKDGDTLRITRPNNTHIRGEMHDIVRISAPDLDALTLDAAIKFSADSLNVDTLNIDAEAATSISIRSLKADTVDVDIDSASSLKLAGTCNRFTLDLGAAASVVASDFKCREATITGGEASSAQVYASERAVAATGTASSIKVSGNPRDFQKKAGFASSISLAD
ncbi:MAG: head GIN domain-containing protein [Hyphomonadaceae bacterium]|nr:head GIN domain-containing protein [Hyphomonadaceae bacterium]